METTSRPSADISDKTPDNKKELERTLHLLLRRTRALVAYAKGKCHERGDLVERAKHIEQAEADFLDALYDMTQEPDATLEDEFLNAPYLNQVIELENAIADLPHVTRYGRISIERLLAKAQELAKAA